MNKTIRDLFTEEEWELLAGKLLPELKPIANLPLTQGEKEAEHEAG